MKKIIILSLILVSSYFPAFSLDNSSDEKHNNMASLLDVEKERWMKNLPTPSEEGNVGVLQMVSPWLKKDLKQEVKIVPQTLIPTIYPGQYKIEAMVLTRAINPTNIEQKYESESSFCIYQFWSGNFLACATVNDEFTVEPSTEWDFPSNLSVKLDYNFEEPGLYMVRVIKKLW